MQWLLTVPLTDWNTFTPQMSSQEVTEETRTYREVLEIELRSALREFERPTFGLFLSAFAAGLNVSFGALFMGMALTFSPSFSSELVKQLVLANVSAVGFVLVILGQTELFTAHTTLGLLPVLNGQAAVADLARLWGVIYVANLIGCTAFAGLIAVTGPALGIVDPSAFGSLADALVPFSAWAITLSGIIAGWLMGLLTWLVAASRDSVGEFLVTWVVASAIGFGPFHHSLLGSTEVLTAVLLAQGVSIADFVHFLSYTTIGNVIGGTVFVAALNYGHAIRGSRSRELDIDVPEEDEDH